MFRFQAQGRIGRIEDVKGDQKVVRLSIAAERSAQGKDGAFTKTEWLNLVSFDSAQNQQILLALEAGQSIKVDGRIEPRKREVNGQTIYDHSFVVSAYERLGASTAKSAETSRAGPGADRA